MSAAEPDNAFFLRELFRTCDQTGTGSVRANVIICKIQNCCQDPQQSTDELELLRCMIDPNHDNGYLNLEQFLRIGEKWLDTVRDSRTTEHHSLRRLSKSSSLTSHPKLASRDSRKSCSDNSLIPTYRSQCSAQNGPFKEARSKSRIPALQRSQAEPQIKAAANVDTSLGILNIADIYEDDKLLVEPTPCGVSIAEVEDLKGQLQKLSKENISLQKQLSTTEETMYQAVAQNDSLKKQLKNGHLSKEMSCKLNEEVLFYRNQYSANDEKCSALKDRLEEAKNECEQLSRENEHLKMEVRQMEDRIRVKEDKYRQVATAMETLQQEVLRLQEEKDQQDQYCRSLRMNEKCLEDKLEATTKAKDQLEEDIKQLKSELSSLSKRKESPTTLLDEMAMKPTADVSCDSPVDFDSEPFNAEGSYAFFLNRHTKALQAGGGPMAFSTPFRSQRESIGDEIKKMSCIATPFSDSTSCSCGGPMGATAQIVETYEVATQTTVAALRAPSSGPPCSTPQPASGSLCSLVLGFLTAVSFLVVAFTFAGAIRLENTTWLPWTWQTWMCEPFLLFSYQTVREVHYW